MRVAYECRYMCAYSGGRFAGLLDRCDLMRAHIDARRPSNKEALAAANSILCGKTLVSRSVTPRSRRTIDRQRQRSTDKRDGKTKDQSNYDIMGSDFLYLEISFVTTRNKTATL